MLCVCARVFTLRLTSRFVFAFSSFFFPSTRRYDNFRFVEHRRLKYGDAEALALSALAEVPDQYRAIRALGIMGGAQDLCLCGLEW